MVRLRNLADLTIRRVAAACFLIFCTSAGASAQSTNIAVGTTAIQPAVKRLGMNFSLQTFYDSGQMTKNLVSRNPGFEGEIFQSTIRCSAGSTSTCLDEDPYSGWPNNFWTGATIEVFYGQSKGRIDTVSGYAAAANGNGGIFTFAGAGVAFGAGDYLIVRKTIPGDAVAGWVPTTYGGGSITTNFSDLPPGTAGTQTVALTSPGSDDLASLATYFDSTNNRSFVALNGTFQLTFKAKGTGGTKLLALRLQRNGQGAYLDQTVQLTSGWSNYTYTFNAAETGAAPGTVALTFATKLADAFLVDDVSLTQLATDPSNSTAFRDPVVNALKTLNPGILRFWGSQLGDSLDNLIATQFARQRSGYSAFSSRQEDISYGLVEFLQLCETLGAEPWIVVPITFSTLEADKLIEFLGGSTSLTYGAKRAALGHPAPWTSAFSKIHLEFGNEAWNGGFKGGVIEVPQVYGLRAQLMFGVMRSNPAYSNSVYDLVLGGQAVFPGRNKEIQNNCITNDSFTLAPYLMGQLDTYATNEDMYGPTFAEAEALLSPSGVAEGVTGGGYMWQNQQALAQSAHPVPISFYETNMGTVQGAISQEALNTYTPSLGAGLAVVDNMLLEMRQGVINQAMFALPQYQFFRPDGKTVPLWGVVVDMGVTDRRRPQYLAMQLANQAIGTNASMLQTVHSGADPTWNQPLVNTVQLNGAHDLHSFAFSSGSQRSLVIFNLARMANLPVTFIGSNSPSGLVTMRQLTSGLPTDHNEDFAKVNITSQVLAGFNAASGITLPPYSMTVLLWGAGANTLPIISSLNSNAVTGTAATISWNTDQPGTTQVLYGSTTSLGLASSLTPSLTTGHSVLLTGLTPGTTYYYSAQSSNSLGQLASSTVLTFTTSATPPVISSVAAGGISTSGATISWLTDRPSTSQVFYGIGTGYGSSTPLDSNLVTSHSVNLSGLSAGVAYNFAASSGVSGASTTSGNFAFTTFAAGLAISSVAASGITTSTATITWITDKASSSQVMYGTTAAHGINSAFDANLLTTHSVTLTALNPNTTYNFAVTSQGSGGSATSSNFTFVTPAAVPVVSSVAVSGLTATTATITWNTDIASSSQVSFGATAGYGYTSTFNAAQVTSHAVTLLALTPSTTYNFAAISVGPAGTATSSNFTFSTPSGLPVISSVNVGALSSTTAAISWVTDKPSTSQILYGLTPAYGISSTFNPVQVTSHVVSLSGLSPGTAYNYTVISVGTGGTVLSSNFTFTTPSSAPVITGVIASAIGSTTATITWTTDQPATSQVQYGNSASYGSSSAFYATPVTSHLVTLTLLSSGVTYNFAVLSVGTSGTSSSTNFTFTTASSGPPVVSAVTANASNTTATVNWTTDKPSTSQVIYGPGNFGSTTSFNSTLMTSHSVTLTGLQPGTSYIFAVVSRTTNGSGTGSSGFATAGAGSADTASETQSVQKPRNSLIRMLNAWRSGPRVSTL